MQELFLDVTRLEKSHKKNRDFRPDFWKKLLLLLDEVADHSSAERSGVRPGGFVGVEAFDDLASLDDVELGNGGLGCGVNCEHLGFLPALRATLLGDSFAPFIVYMIPQIWDRVKF